MATYTDTLGFNKGTAGYHEKGLHRVSLMSVDLDFPAIIAARLAAGATALAAADVMEVLAIPAKTFVIAAGIDITTASGVTGTLDMGDGVDPDGYLDGVNANAVASASGAVAGLIDGKYYAAADTIDLTLLTAVPAAMVCRVWAVVANCS